VLPAVRIAAVILVAACLTLAAGAPINQVSAKGALLDWILLGPFETRPLEAPAPGGVTRSGFHRDFLEPLGGESAAVLHSGSTVTYKTALGRKRLVRAQSIGPSHESRESPVLRHIMQDRHIIEEDYNQAVAYAYCQVHSNRAQRVCAYFASNGSPKIWLNGKLVHQFFQEERQAFRWQDSMMLDLREGLNSVLVKIDNRRGYWGFELELYESEHHADAIRKLGPALVVEPGKPAAGALPVTTRLNPRPLGPAPPVELRLTGASGKELMAARTQTGMTITLQIPSSIAGHVFLEGKVLDPVYAETKPVRAQAWAGDIDSAVSALKTRFNKASANIGYLDPAWRPIHQAMFDWVRWFLDQPVQEVDWWIVKSLDYIRQFTEALEDKRNFVAGNLGKPMPAWFEGSGGRGQYQFFLPVGFVPGKGNYPLIIELHGSMTRERKITFDDTMNTAYLGAYAGSGGSAVIGIAPRGPFPFHGWETAFLNTCLARVKEVLPVDGEKVYLQGASGGGLGAWRWLLENPEHFAAASPRCGFEGHPYKASRLRNVPVWIFNGELDLASRAFQPELMKNAMLRAGGDARLTMFPNLGHTLGEAVDRKALKDWLLSHRRSAFPPPPDPLEGITSRPVEIIHVPAVTAVNLVESERFLYPQDNIYRTSMKLYEAYRKPAGESPRREADGAMVIRKPPEIRDDVRQALIIPPPGVIWKPEGPLEAVALPAIQAARAFLEGTPEEFEAQKAALYRRIESMGLKRTGEERAVVYSLESARRLDSRLYELQIGVE
jgi:hypothetical protein